MFIKYIGKKSKSHFYTKTKLPLLVNLIVVYYITEYVLSSKKKKVNRLIRNMYCILEYDFITNQNYTFHDPNE